jgi:hypothetical protein
MDQVITASTAHRLPHDGERGKRRSVSVTGTAEAGLDIARRRAWPQRRVTAVVAVPGAIRT